MSLEETFVIKEPVKYVPQGKELEIAMACIKRSYPLMLRGPTGCGKTTLAMYLAHQEGLPFISLTCNEDTDPGDFIGRYTTEGYVDGRAATAFKCKNGAILYIDEIGEARQDAIVVVHSMTDDRRQLENPLRNEVYAAPNKFLVVASYNPGYQLQNKLKPSTMQRFVTIDLEFPAEEQEVRIVLEKNQYLTRLPVLVRTAVSEEVITQLVQLAHDFRKMAQSREAGLKEGPGTRLVVRTKGLIEEGIEVKTAIKAGMINPLTHKLEVKETMEELLNSRFGT